MSPDQVRAALDQLRTDVNARLTRIEDKLDNQTPRVAVLERRCDDQEKKSERRWQTWVALALSLLAFAGSIVGPIIGGS